MIRERVRNGLANAKAKGVRLGRLKTRPSEMIRILRNKGQSYRAISQLLGISSGSVSSEIRAMKKEIAEGKYQIPIATQKVVATTNSEPKKVEVMEEPKIELEIERF